MNLLKWLFRAMALFYTGAAVAIAYYEGRDAIGWVLLCVLVGIIAVLVSIILTSEEL